MIKFPRQLKESLQNNRFDWAYGAARYRKGENRNFSECTGLHYPLQNQD